MKSSEKRKHERLHLQLDLFCQRVGVGQIDIYTGKTVNVSTGGMLFHLAEGKLSNDDILNVELTVPPTDGLLELGGKVSTVARVIRVHQIHNESGKNLHHAIAAEFLENPRLVV